MTTEAHSLCRFPTSSRLQDWPAAPFCLVPANNTSTNTRCQAAAVCVCAASTLPATAVSQSPPRDGFRSVLQELACHTRQHSRSAHSAHSARVPLSALLVVSNRPPGTSRQKGPDAPSGRVLCLVRRVLVQCGQWRAPRHAHLYLTPLSAMFMFAYLHDTCAWRPRPCTSTYMTAYLYVLSTPLAPALPSRLCIVGRGSRIGTALLQSVSQELASTNRLGQIPRTCAIGHTPTPSGMRLGFWA
jgi:hypothetical protein